MVPVSLERPRVPDPGATTREESLSDRTAHCSTGCTRSVVRSYYPNPKLPPYGVGAHTFRFLSVTRSDVREKKHHSDPD